MEIEQLRRTFQVGEVEVQALRGVDLKLTEGSFTAIMGSSGSGKSTLLSLLGCLDRPSAGTYRLGGQNVGTMSDDELSQVRSSRLGFIFQAYNLIPQLTVLENIQIPLLYQKPKPEDQFSRCQELAALVGLEDRLDHRPSQLSGGQQQRVAIARALVNEPLLILADEPTGNLDSATEQEILELFRSLHSQGKTLVVVTHDDAVAESAERVITMKDGVIENDRLLKS